MRWLRLLKSLLVILVLAGLAAVGYFTRATWLPWVNRATPAVSGPAEKPATAPAGESQQVRLTPQAQNNLRLVAKPLQTETYWRTIQVAGMVVDRPAQSDRSVVAPFAGVVTQVHHFPGDTVRPGEALFTLRLLGDSLQPAQAKLFETMQEMQLTLEQKQLLPKDDRGKPINPGRLLELDTQLRRLAVTAQTYRQDLRARNLTPEQIEEVALGKPVTEMTLAVPRLAGHEKLLLTGLVKEEAGNGDRGLSYEMQELKVKLDQQVQAGQTLAVLSNHQALYIEGRAFRQETALVEKAAKEGWPIQVEFMEDKGSDWPALEQAFVIRHIANTIDPVSRTFAFYLPLVNQSRSFVKEDRTFVLWRFRPGQKVRLHLKVEKFENVFVLPTDAVVREGPEAYVFRQNGDLFDRKPVQIVYQDRQHVILANDGSVAPGLYVTRNGATQLNRVLKTAGGQPAGFHVHADGSVHFSNH